MSNSSRPILYSFRRCPYAMRARMSIVRTNHICEHREVILRDRPEHMMQISPKGTVPVMLLANGEVIEESLEIMQYVLSWELSDIESQWARPSDAISPLPTLAFSARSPGVACILRIGNWSVSSGS